MTTVHKIKQLTAGFTLVEMLVVIGILAILLTATVTLINPIDQINKGRDTSRKNDLQKIQTAVESYYQDFGVYPTSVSFKISDTDHPTGIAWGAGWPPYMQTLPKDPSSSKNYVYYSDNNNQQYYLYTSLDRGSKDLQACNSNGTACPKAIQINASCGTGVCNYGITSTNTSP